MNKVRTKLKDTWLITFTDYIIKSFKKTLSSTHRVKLKFKSLKRGFGGWGYGFSGCDGLGGFGGFGGFGAFCGLGGFDGFSGFDGYPMLSLKGFSVSFTLLLKVLYLLVSYPLSYTWLKREPQISIRKERFIRRYLQYDVLGDCVF